MSRAGMIVAGIYFAIALVITLADELTPPASGWISFKHLGTTVATFPATAPLAMLGFEPNFDSKLTIAAMLAASTAIVYAAVWLVAWLFASR